jgi:hypothetical protein
LIKHRKSILGHSGANLGYSSFALPARNLEKKRKGWGRLKI